MRHAFLLLIPLATSQLFKIPDEAKTAKSIMKLYREFHAEKCNPKLSCKQKPFILFEPQAGLGDTANAMLAAFHIALKSGYMFQVNWRFHSPKMTFSKSWIKTFSRQYRRENCDVVKVCKPRTTIKGHVVSGHTALTLDVVNKISDQVRNDRGWMKVLLQPSEKVLKLVDEFQPDSCDAVVVRTGLHDYNEFLHPGDEDRFTYCVSQLKSPNTVFLAADDDEIKNNLKSAMVRNGLDVVVIPDSISHIAHSKDDEKILRTFAEFHIISHCKRHILTSNSLFWCYGFYAKTSTTALLYLSPIL